MSERENAVGQIRIKWIDFAKGIAIFLVVLGHSLEGTIGISAEHNVFHIAIYSFHMPFFFMLSGMLFSDNKYISFKKFIAKKFCTLIIPSYAFAMIMVIIDIIKCGKVWFGGVAVIRTLLQFRVETLANYWFLPTLFFSFIIMWIVHKIFENDKKRVICCLIISCMGAIYITVITKPLPFSFDNALLIIIFMEVGYQLKKKLDVINKKSNIVCVCMGITWIMCTYLNYTYFGKQSISLAYVTLLNPVLFFISAMAGSIFVLLLCSQLKKSNRINIWGQHTLVIYLLGGVVLNRILSCVSIIEKNIWINVILCIGASVITVEISCILSALIKRWFPYILGEKKKNKDRENVKTN